MILLDKCQDEKHREYENFNEMIFFQKSSLCLLKINKSSIISMHVTKTKYFTLIGKFIRVTNLSEKFFVKKIKRK